MPNNAVTPFAFDDHLVRTVIDEEGNPWFAAKDVCSILEIQNPSDTVKKILDDDEKGIATIYTLGGEQEILTISESGLYSLVFRSRKPQARAFSKWVRTEVLPSLCRTGSYTMPTPDPQVLPAGEFPPEALTLRPAMRQRLWQDAMQAARLDNAGSDSAMQWFGKLCRLMGVKVVAPADNSIQRFIAEGCTHEAGFRMASSKLWQCYVHFCTQILGMNAHSCLSNKAFSISIQSHPEVRCLRHRPTTIFVGLRPLQQT